MEYSDSGGGEGFYADADELLKCDAEFAAKLQRQFDDEDMLAAQLSSSVNFAATRPQLANSNALSDSRGSRNDEEIARRLQRNFYLDMKKQGFSDMHLASMLDTLAPDTSMDSDMRRAVQESLGESGDQIAGNDQSCVEKYLLSLYNNSRFMSDAREPPPYTDEFTEFRRQATGSVRELADDSLMGVQKIIETMVNRVLPTVQTWDELEAALFIVSAVADRINHYYLDHCIESIVEVIVKTPSDSNPILLNTTIILVGHLARWFFANKQSAAKCMRWMLGLPPYEKILGSLSLSFEKIASLMHSDMTCFFSTAREFLPYIQSSVDDGAKMEDCAQCFIRGCTWLLNDMNSNEMVEGLALLLEQPMQCLEKIAANREPSQSSSGSWERLASEPTLWIDRMNCVFQTLNPWTSQRDYLNEENVLESAPWNPVFANAFQAIFNVVVAFADNETVVDHSLMTMISLISTDRRNNSHLIKELLRLLATAYNANRQPHLLQYAKTVVDEYTVGMELESEIAEFLQAICCPTFKAFWTLVDASEYLPLLKMLFLTVNTFARLRTARFVVEPVAKEVFEMAIYGLGVGDYEIHDHSQKYISMLLQFSQTGSTSELMESALRNVSQILTSHAEELVQKCLRVGILGSSLNLATSCSEILYELVALENSRMRDLLHNFLLSLCAEREIKLSAEQVNEFAQRFGQCQSRNDVVTLIAELSLHFQST